MQNLTITKESLGKSQKTMFNICSIYIFIKLEVHDFCYTAIVYSVGSELQLLMQTLYRESPLWNKHFS